MSNLDKKYVINEIIMNMDEQELAELISRMENDVGTKDKYHTNEMIDELNRLRRRLHAMRGGG